MIKRLPAHEEELIYQLAEQLTGACQQGKYRRQVLVSNVLRRIEELQLKSFEEYMRYIDAHPKEVSNLISAVTIHTTSWFREKPHFEVLKDFLEQNKLEIQKLGRPFRLWSAACSTGEEAYSFALVLENFRSLYPTFEYEVVGSDIDPVSVEKASRGVFKRAHSEIPEGFRQHFLFGSGHTKELMTLPQNIRRRVRFKVHNLLEAWDPVQETFDFVVCRNVLIYFAPENIDKAIKRLKEKLSPIGTLCLGHSEVITPEKYSMVGIGNSCYKAMKTEEQKKNEKKKILIVDDSELIRTMLTRIFEQSPFSTYAVPSAKDATEYLTKNSVDLITLDLNMPEMSGQEWLKQARMRGLRSPVIIVSDANPAEATKVLGALEEGAQDYIEKKHIHAEPKLIIDKCAILIQSMEKQGANGVREVSKNSKNYPALSFAPQLILIGASTGGPETLAKVMRNFPTPCPPVLVVQHIAHQFSKPLADRLSKISGLPLGQILDDTPLKDGHLYISNGDFHIGVRKLGGKLKLARSNSPPLHGHRPCVDYLYQTVAATATPTLAILLTGMGRDGAIGLFELKKNGSFTAAQDEHSCVVFGMPKEAIRLGAVDFVGNPSSIKDLINYVCRRNFKLNQAS